MEAQDNSGNRSDTGGSGGGLLRLGIDTVGPKIEVNYTDDVQPRNENIFPEKDRADRCDEAGM